MGSKEPAPAYDKQFLQTIAEDLEYLGRLSKSEPSEADLRRASTLLRRFIVEQDLINAWRMLKMEPKQPVITGSRLPITPRGVAFAGGGIRAGIAMSQMTIIRGPINVEEILARSRNPPQVEVEQTLNEYVNGTAVSIEGKRITRNRLVAYVANKLGGAHYDAKRKSDEEAYQLLDGVGRDMTVAGNENVEMISQLHFELLSISQAIVDSADMQRMRIKLSAAELALPARGMTPWVG